MISFTSTRGRLNFSALVDSTIYRDCAYTTKCITGRFPYDSIAQYVQPIVFQLSR